MNLLKRNLWREGDQSRRRIPAMPLWIAGIRFAQFACSLATAVATIYGLHTMQKATNYRRITSFSGTEGFPFSWFAFSWTTAYFMWLGASIVYFPVMYNAWVQLGLEILAVIFWLVAMSLLASHADDLSSLDSFIVTFGSKYEVYYKENVEPFAKGFVFSTYLGTAMSSATLILFFVTLIQFGRSLHAHLQLSPKAAQSDKVDTEVDCREDQFRSSDLPGQDSHYFVPELHGQNPRHQTLELHNHDPRYFVTELRGQDSHRQTSELQSRDPRYFLAELRGQDPCQADELDTPQQRVSNA